MGKTQPYIEALSEVIQHFGGCTKLATALGIKHPAISQWVKKGRIPPLRCYQIENCSKGKFTFDQLCFLNEQAKINSK